MTTKLKIALGGAAAAGCGAAGGATAHEYGYPIYFSLEEGGKKDISVQKIIEEIENIKEGTPKTLHFPGECKVTFHKINFDGSNSAGNNLTKELKEKILKKFSDLTGFFKRWNVNSFIDECKKNGKTKYIKLRWNTSANGWGLEATDIASNNFFS